MFSDGSRHLSLQRELFLQHGSVRRVGRVDESFPLNVQPQTRGRHLVDTARRVDARNREYLVRRVEQVVEANDRQEVTQLQQQRSYRGQEAVEVNER